MNSQFWNEMYGADEYAYGTEPNDFLKSHIELGDLRLKPHARVLCLAEGQGRNAVYLAQQGFDVTMIDYSETGLQKARELAASKGVSIETICADLSDYSLELDSWDAIVIVFGHFPAVVRKKVYPQLWGALKEGGMLISETYSPKQVEYQTGGPKDPSMMASEDELRSVLKEFRELKLNELVRDIHEGQYHNGTSCVIQVVAVK